MQLRISVSRRAVQVAGGEEAVALEEDPLARAVGPSPRPASLPLHVAERNFNRALVRGLDLVGSLRAAERPGQGDRLGSREGEIEAGDRAVTGDGPQPKRLARRGVHAGQHRHELVRLDLARQP
jgi:hypothetical protein